MPMIDILSLEMSTYLCVYMYTVHQICSAFGVHVLYVHMHICVHVGTLIPNDDHPPPDILWRITCTDLMSLRECE